MPLLPVLSPSQSAAWDARASRAGIALATLMESAGRAVAAVLLREFPHAARQGVLIAAGNGHNGGDGWVLARALHRLELNGAITATWGVSDNNRKAKYYEITTKGRHLVAQEHKAWDELSAAVHRVLAN